MNILIVEDESVISEAIENILQNIPQVNIIHRASCFDTGFTKALQQAYDLILIDINLNEEMNGIDLCTSIRKTNTQIPIIIITSYGSDEYLEKAFEAGANDYITKPFNRKEIELRSKRWLMMSYKIITTQRLEYEELSYDVDKNTFFYQERKIELTKKEKLLLLVFIKTPAQVIPSEHLEQKLWGDYEVNPQRNIRSNIQTLKKSLMLQKVPIGDWIKNKRGEGYIFQK